MSVDQFLLSADTTDLNYPEIRPTLDLNFARVKALDPRITFTRASGGSYVGADGLIKYAGVNEARFDHDPVTGESLGLLIEESRTNLLTRSEAFDDSSWAKSAASISSNLSNIVSPDGTLTSEKIIENTQNVQHLVWKSRSGTNETVTFSVFVKAAERTQCLLQLSNFQNAACSATYDLQSGKIIATVTPTGDYINVSSSIIPYPNGWYRCILTATKQSVNTTNNPTISTVRRNNIGIYQGDGTSGIYVWGAQLEVGAFPTSYIPTQASTRTRAADNAFISGNEFFNIFNENEGTFFSKSKTSGQGSGAFFVGDINTQPISQDYIDILRYQLNFLRAGISLQETENTSVAINSTLPLGDVYKAVHAYNLNKSVLYVDGNLIGRINSRKRIIPKNLKILQIGKHRSGFYLNGHIYRLTYFNRLLQDSQLQSLTR
jgi:hypothetical protein